MMDVSFPMNIALFTTPPNAVLEYLAHEPCVDLRLLDVTQGRNVLSLDLGHPDMILIYRCPFMLPKSLYSSTRLGAYNIHPSLLPAYPGLNPWKDIFDDVEKFRERSSEPFCCGVTLHALSDSPDAGAIVCQSPFDIGLDDTINSARDKSDAMAASLLRTWLGTMMIN